MKSNEKLDVNLASIFINLIAMIESEYISTPSISIYPSFLKWSFPILSLLNIIQLRQNPEFFLEKMLSVEQIFQNITERFKLKLYSESPQEELEHARF